MVFLSRLGITSLDGLAKTKESDKVLQGKSWCTLARSASDPKQQLSAYLKALESLGERYADAYPLKNVNGVGVG